jgi:hypothetical protein
MAGAAVQGARLNATSVEISVKFLFGTFSGIARCASKLLYCGVTVLRDRIRVPDESSSLG